jgi:hypothetical protein
MESSWNSFFAGGMIRVSSGYPNYTTFLLSSRKVLQSHSHDSIYTGRSFGEKVQAKRRFPTPGTAAQEIGALLNEPAM